MQTSEDENEKHLDDNGAGDCPREAPTDAIGVTALWLEAIADEEKPESEGEPYAHLYAARRVYECLLTSKVLTVEQRAIIQLKLGENLINTEEDGSSQLDAAVLTLDNQREKTGLGILVCALNSRSLLAVRRGEYRGALTLLSRAEQLGSSWQAADAKACPLPPFTYFVEEEGFTGHGEKCENCLWFERQITLISYYQAQVYLKLGEKDRSAERVILTLDRQLQFGDLEKGTWALDSATLSQFYLARGRLKTARYWLLASLAMEQIQDEPDSRSHTEITRCCIKFGVNILEQSVHSLNGTLELDDEDTPDLESQLHHLTDDLKEVMSRVNLPTGECAKSFEEARSIFVLVQTWIRECQEYYSFYDHCPDFVELSQDYSKIYMFLSEFENDVTRKCQMHKRRVDMLEDILKELSSQHYLTFYRELTFEVAEALFLMVDLKIEQLKEQTASIQATKKINTLIAHSNSQYDMFLATYNTANGDAPAKFPDNDVRTAILCVMAQASLHTKLVEGRTRQRLDNLEKAREKFSFVAEYAEKRDPGVREKLQRELETCKEMMDLLLVKMEKIRESGLPFQ